MKIRPTERGPQVEAVQHHHADLPDQVPGEHLWIVVSMFRVNPKPEQKYQLDTENLLTIEGPGCYWCEKPWTRALGRSRCSGRPA